MKLIRKLYRKMLPLLMAAAMIPASGLQYVKAAPEESGALIDAFSGENETGDEGLQAKDLAGMSDADVIETIGPLCTQDQEVSGILASITVAQFILESGYGKSGLSQDANNCFGMKASLSGNNWEGSVWDGVSTCSRPTGEWVGTGYRTITAAFRKYPNIEHSIADHSAYLIGSLKGSMPRYPGIAGCTDHREAISIIVNGGYCSSPSYVGNIMALIEKWNLTRFDVDSAATRFAPAAAVSGGTIVETMYQEEGEITRMDSEENSGPMYTSGNTQDAEKGTENAGSADNDGGEKEDGPEASGTSDEKAQKDENKDADEDDPGDREVKTAGEDIRG